MMLGFHGNAKKKGILVCRDLSLEGSTNGRIRGVGKYTKAAFLEPSLS